MRKSRHTLGVWIDISTPPPLPLPYLNKLHDPSSSTIGRPRMWNEIDYVYEYTSIRSKMHVTKFNETPPLPPLSLPTLYQPFLSRTEPVSPIYGSIQVYVHVQVGCENIYRWKCSVKNYSPSPLISSPVIATLARRLISEGPAHTYVKKC